ncbi:hypothetical protein C8J57DRAFT_1465742 [Mycena rebaudengoi]|nr:hypothetical protein C8J57DRAFT_1465742 [Mycena rebaudengoi]
MLPVAGYVLAVVGTVAAGIPFKEPHIAPHIERWAEELLVKREAQRLKRGGLCARRATSREAGIDVNEANSDGERMLVSYGSVLTHSLGCSGMGFTCGDGVRMVLGWNGAWQQLAGNSRKELKILPGQPNPIHTDFRRPHS